MQDRQQLDNEAILARLAPEPGWSALGVPPARISRPPGQGAFVPTEPDGRLCLRCYQRDHDQRVVAKAWFGPGAEGPPGHAHGGSQAAVMDHVLGAAAWAAGYPCFTASLTHDYRRPLPLGSVVLVEAWVDSVDGRKVKMAGRLLGLRTGDYDPADATVVRAPSSAEPREAPTVYGETRGLFVQIDGERLTRMAEIRRRIVAGEGADAARR